MKRYLLICLISLLTLIACNQQVSIPDGYYDYERSEVEDAVKGLSFKPETPAFVPIQVDFVISDQYLIKGTDQEALDVSFYSKENDLLTFQAVDGDFNEPIVGDSVTIDKKVKGSYVDNKFAKTLYWRKYGIAYKLVFRSGIVKSEVVSNNISKKELVKVAKSFQL